MGRLPSGLLSCLCAHLPQAHAKKVLAVAVHNHYKRVEHDVEARKAAAAAAAAAQQASMGAGAARQDEGLGQGAEARKGKGSGRGELVIRKGRVGGSSSSVQCVGGCWHAALVCCGWRRKERFHEAAAVGFPVVWLGWAWRPDACWVLLAAACRAELCPIPPFMPLLPPSSSLLLMHPQASPPSSHSVLCLTSLPPSCI